MQYNLLEVKESKFMVVLACISTGLLECLFLALALSSAIRLFNENRTFDDEVVCSIILISSIVFSVIIAIMIIYILRTYRYQVDIYMDDKLVRKRKGIVIFELCYNDIISMREGIFSLYLYCKGPITMANGKKGPRTIYEHYAKRDKVRIKQLISPKIQR